MPYIINAVSSKNFEFPKTLPEYVRGIEYDTLDEAIAAAKKGEEPGEEYREFEVICTSCSLNADEFGYVTVPSDCITGIEYVASREHIILPQYATIVPVVKGFVDVSAMRKVENDFCARSMFKEAYNNALSITSPDAKNLMFSTLYARPEIISRAHKEIETSLILAYHFNSEIYATKSPCNLSKQIFNEALREFVRSTSVESTMRFMDFMKSLESHINRERHGEYGLSIVKATTEFISSHRDLSSNEISRLEAYGQKANDIVEAAIQRHKGYALIDWRCAAEICALRLSETECVDFSKEKLAMESFIEAFVKRAENIYAVLESNVSERDASMAAIACTIPDYVPMENDNPVPKEVAAILEEINDILSSKQRIQGVVRSVISPDYEAFTQKTCTRLAEDGLYNLARSPDGIGIIASQVAMECASTVFGTDSELYEAWCQIANKFDDIGDPTSHDEPVE